MKYREGSTGIGLPAASPVLTRAETQEASAPDPARSRRCPRWAPYARRSQPTALDLVSALNFLSPTLPRCCGIEDPARGQFPTSGDILRPLKPHCHLASLPPTAFSHQLATSSSHRPPGTAAIAPWIPHGRRSRMDTRPIGIRVGVGVASVAQVSVAQAPSLGAAVRLRSRTPWTRQGPRHPRCFLKQTSGCPHAIAVRQAAYCGQPAFVTAA